MKYCTKCGKELMDEAVICPHCGCAIESAEKTKNESNWMPIAGFVCSFFIPILGWIFGGLGLKKSKELYDDKGKKFSIAALIISSVVFIINFIVLMSY